MKPIRMIRRAVSALLVTLLLLIGFAPCALAESAAETPEEQTVLFDAGGFRLSVGNYNAETCKFPITMQQTRAGSNGKLIIRPVINGYRDDLFGFQFSSVSTEPMPAELDFRPILNAIHMEKLESLSFVLWVMQSGVLVYEELYEIPLPEQTEAPALYPGTGDILYEDERVLLRLAGLRKDEVLPAAVLLFEVTNKMAGMEFKLNAFIRAQAGKNAFYADERVTLYPNMTAAVPVLLFQAAPRGRSASVPADLSAIQLLLTVHDVNLRTSYCPPVIDYAVDINQLTFFE